MCNYDKGFNVIDDVSYVSVVSDLTIPLMIIKKNLLQADLFPGCIERCYCCAAQPNSFTLLKEGIQHLMEKHIIIVENIPSI